MEYYDRVEEATAVVGKIVKVDKNTALSEAIQYLDKSHLQERNWLGNGVGGVISFVKSIFKALSGTELLGEEGPKL